MSYNPFDLTGGPFLILYVALFGLAVFASFRIARRLRPEGRMQTLKDPDMLAYLAGGPERFTDMLVARLLSSGALAMVGKRDFAVVAAGRGTNAAERGLLALPQPLTWPAIQRGARAHVGPLVARMQAAGLLMDDAARTRIRLLSFLPYAALLCFGAAKWVIGDLRDRPVAFLSALLLVTMVAAILRWVMLDPRTRAGKAALSRATDAAERLRRAPTRDETGLAVALFGTAVLAGSGFAAFHQFRHAGSSDSGSSDSGGDSDGGGCGGGGCGGCGD